MVVVRDSKRRLVHMCVSLPFLLVSAFLDFSVASILPTHSPIAHHHHHKPLQVGATAVICDLY